MAVSNILAGRLGQYPVYLWTLPRFHYLAALFMENMDATVLVASAEGPKPTTA
jgi:hypothetical protein